ncbi:hypothetical protein CEXT_634141 [Caerostris extrusa]|uniref:Uncharacterized protein n=1 Tax=Caerostris extrusa TaxID=172846 RepID=A0AAV4RF88_CAEEX|nr:hypothetical protein CEXT_634141 [Caerostris extrusa]
MKDVPVPEVKGLSLGGIINVPTSRSEHWFRQKQQEQALKHFSGTSKKILDCIQQSEACGNLQNTESVFYRLK